MKIVINNCYGGFSISNRAIAMLAKLNGKKAYFFDGGLNEPYNEIEADGESSMWNTAFSTKDVSVLNDLMGKEDEESQAKRNAFWDEYYLTSRPEDRTEPKLIQVIEKLGKKANGDCADLKIVEIPDGVEYSIQEYDGNEWVAESHRTWS